MSDRTPSQQATLDRSAALEHQVQAAPRKFRVVTGDRPTAPCTSATTSAPSPTVSG
jgi:hypothetical protein